MKLSPLTLAALFATVVFTVLPACKSDTPSNHDTWVEDADQRWNSVKSAIAIQMAEDQFNGGQLGLAQKTIEEAMVKDMENPELWLLGGRIFWRNGTETAHALPSPSNTVRQKDYSQKKKQDPTTSRASSISVGSASTRLRKSTAWPTSVTRRMWLTFSRRSRCMCTWTSSIKPPPSWKARQPISIRTRRCVHC